MNASTASAAAPTVRNEPFVWLGILAALVGVLLWTYWNTVQAIMSNWSRPQYSHGYLIPIFSLALLWLRYEPIGEVKASERWWGVALLAIGLGLRYALSYFALIIGDMATLVVSLLGVFLMVGGWRMLRWSWPAIAFLAFALPLPDFVERGILDPLQHWATRASTYVLQTLGFPAYSEGNTIRFSSNADIQLGVVDACSGLRMLTIFLAMATAVTLVIALTWWEKLIVLLSAVPIAMVVNVFRISVMGILHLTVGREIADRVFHDFAGWVMMPMALGLLYVELQLLSNLFIETSETQQTLRDTLHQPSL